MQSRKRNVGKWRETLASGVLPPAAKPAIPPMQPEAASSPAGPGADMRKRKTDTPIEEIDLRAGGDADRPEVVVEKSGNKRSSDTAMEEID